MKAKAEKTHVSKPQVQRQSARTQLRDTGLFVPPSVQTKLTINAPGDAFEKEADAMADQVVNTPVQTKKEESPGVRLQPEAEEEEMLQMQPEEQEEEMLQMQAEEEEEAIQRQCTDCEEEESLQMQPEEEEEEILQMQPEEEEETIQRQCTDCEEEETLQMQAEEEEEEMLQMQPDEEEEELQRSASGTASGKATAPPIVNQVVSGGGESMDSGTRGHMENRFGTDFSSVRIHKDTKAQQSAKAISAQAYTYGSHVVFARGKYEPHTASGQHLLAHELTHVVQQGHDVRRRLENENNTSSTAPPSTTNAEGPASIPPQQAENNAAPTEPDLPAENLPDAEAAEAGPAPSDLLEPIMPPPPEELNPEARSRMRQAQNNAGTAAENNATLPTADESTQEARGGVTEPTEETSARASGQLTATLSERPAPSPEIEELCENIRRVIRDKRPPDEDSLLQADPEEAANEAGTQLNDNVESDVDRVEGQYDDLDENPVGEAEQIGEEIDMPPEEVGSPAINAEGAAPDPLPEEEVSLEADVEASATQMEDAGMSTEVADVIQDGPVAEARAVHEELEQTAAEDPAVVLAEQDAALGSARDDMESLQAQALAALEASRSGTVGESGAQQLSMVGSEEEQRMALGTAAENIFTAAQEQVNLLLEPLTDTAMEMWETGKTRIATEFEQHLARVQSWVDERHSGFGGGVTELWDDLTGLPGWVTDEYDDAERNFGDSICELIREISTYVNGVILTCEELIDNANTEIDELFANAPEELQEWAAQQQEIFQGRLDGLRDQVHDTQQSFNEDLANRAAQAVQDVREQVHALREAAKGLLGQIADAIADFLEDPIRAIINGLLSLVGIEPSAFWALVARIQQVMEDIANDPLGFASNLMEAIGAGFDNFFNNFFTHLFEGFINWIFSGLGAVGVEIPADFSLSSIITFFLQLMGITWERIRELLAKHIGEENVALLEQAYEIITDLIELGPQGVFELIKDQLDPQAILDQVIEMAVDFVIETLITQATIRIAMLFNPVGAIAQAIEAIYRVLSWIFENAARIFTLVETVVNGIADIVAGNIAGMAATVENALTQILVPVIDFVAGFMGLGGLPEKVADMVRGLQNWIEGILDRVIGWLATQARNILSALGIREDADPEEEEEEAAAELEDMEVGEELTFTADEERHRLWIDTAGAGVEVMVNSTPMTVGEKLDEWNAKLGDLPEEQQGEASSLLPRAREQYNTVLREGAEAEEEIAEAQESPSPEEVEQAERADDEVETAQQALKSTLSRLFDVFGEVEMDLSLVREDFTNEAGDHHEIYFEGSELYIASASPKTYRSFIQGIQIDTSSAEKVAAKNELLRLLGELENLTEGKDKEEDIAAVVQAMTTQTRLLFVTGRSSIPVWGALDAAGYGTHMVAEFLTSEAPPGVSGSSPTSAANTQYEKINKRRKGGGSYYIKGHLLSERLNGPGMWYNLSPLTGVVNTQNHERDIENKLKNETTEAPAPFWNKKAFRYEVKVMERYGLNQSLINQINASTEPVADQATKKEIVEGEAYVPKGFEISVTELNPQTKAPMGVVPLPNVTNTIDQSGPTAYQISAVQISYPIRLSTAPVEDIKKLFSDSIAQNIFDTFKEDKKKPAAERKIKSLKDLAENVPYLRFDRLKALALEKKIKF